MEFKIGSYGKLKNKHTFEIHGFKSVEADSSGTHRVLVSALINGTLTVISLEDIIKDIDFSYPIKIREWNGYTKIN